MSSRERPRYASPELVRKLITALAGAAELLGTDRDYRNGKTHRFAVEALEAADAAGVWIGGGDAAERIAELEAELEAVEEYVSDAERHAGAGYRYVHPDIPRELVERIRAALGGGS